MSNEIFGMGMFLSSFVVMKGLLIAQKAHYEFMDQKMRFDKTILGSSDIEKLRKEFDEYKKRVDSLMLKSGFKL